VTVGIASTISRQLHCQECPRRVVARETPHPGEAFDTLSAPKRRRVGVRVSRVISRG
jgi:hypothetical protein